MPENALNNLSNNNAEEQAREVIASAVLDLSISDLSLPEVNIDRQTLVDTATDLEEALSALRENGISFDEIGEYLDVLKLQGVIQEVSLEQGAVLEVFDLQVNGVERDGIYAKGELVLSEPVTGYQDKKGNLLLLDLDSDFSGVIQYSDGGEVEWHAPMPLKGALGVFKERSGVNREEAVEGIENKKTLPSGRIIKAAA